MKPLYDLPAGLTADELLHQLRQHEQARFCEYQRQTRGLLALIRAVTRRSAATARSSEEFAAHLEGRLDAVSRVHGILLRLPGAAVDLMELVSEEFLAQAVPDEQVELGGPPVTLSGKAAGSLALALHELTTNALKFGALATPSGRLSVRWGWDAESPLQIHLEWREHGVPIPDEESRHQGFGMEMIERTLPYELRARTSMAFTRDGVRCMIVFNPDDPERHVFDRSGPGGRAS
jgi:two-component system, chemotaxis family, CheB/CheR fusion protein